MENKHLNTLDSIFNSIPNEPYKKEPLPVYDLDNLPPLNIPSWEIEQLFLRKIKKGVIPNLGL